MSLLIGIYALFFTLLPSLSPKATLWLHFGHALSWCLFHCFGLGLLLRAQSQSKFYVRHFLKNYHYPPNGGGAIQEAFANWKAIYNMSLCMTYGELPLLLVDVRSIRVLRIGSFCVVSFIGIVWKTYSIPADWKVGTELLRHTLGLVRRPSCSYTAPSDYGFSGSCRPAHVGVY